MTRGASQNPKTFHEQIGPAVWLQALLACFAPADWNGDAPVYVAGAANLQPDVILMDINMPRLSGIEVATKIRVLSPRSKIVFLSEAANYEFVTAAFEVGGLGYVLKSDSGKDLVAGIRAVLQGRQFVSRSLRDLGMA